jgi:hypothetical protein
MAKRWVAEVMSKASHVNQIWIYPERGSKFSSDLRDLE